MSMLDVSDHPKVIDAERKGVHFESRRRWYALDDADRITHVSPGWSEPENKLLGRTIWEFFSGTATHHIYKNIFQSIRGKRATASLDIRCDQPDRLIELRVVVSGGADRQLLVTFETLREAPTEYQSLWDPAAVRSRQTVRACSWCQSIHVHDGLWLPFVDAVGEIGLLQANNPPDISHGICESCSARLGL